MSRLGPYELNQVYTGDARELAPAIPDGSVDLVFTDPPYGKEYLPLYSWLAEESARVLKPNGFLLTYAGVYWKDDVMARIRNHMDYFTDIVMLNPGGATMAWNRKLILRHKYITAYQQQGQRSLPRTNVMSVWNGDGRDKRFHRWGQAEGGPSYLIECFTNCGDIVVDFFFGGGTTGAVCTQSRRQWVGFEIDPSDADIARARLGRVQLAMQPLYEQAALL